MPNTCTGVAGSLNGVCSVPKAGEFVTGAGLMTACQSIENDLATIKSVMEISAPATAQIPATASFTGQGLGPTLDGVWRPAASLVLRGQGAGVQLQNAWRLAANVTIASTSGAALSGSIKASDLTLTTGSRFISGTSVGLAGSWLVEASATLGIAAGATLGVLGDGVVLIEGSVGHLALVAFGGHSYTEHDSGSVDEYKSGAVIQLDSGSKITSASSSLDGDFSFDAGAGNVLNLNSFIVRTKSMTRSGVNAYEELRDPVVGRSTSGVITTTAQDWINNPSGIAGAINWELDAPAKSIEVTMYFDSNGISTTSGRDIHVKIPGGAATLFTALAGLGSFSATVVLFYDKTVPYWRIKSVLDYHGVISGL